MKQSDVRKAFLVLLSAGALVINALGQVGPGAAGVFQTIPINGDFSQWSGVPVAYTDEDPGNNPGGVDFSAVYLANDANYLYVYYTLYNNADPIDWANTAIYISNNPSNPSVGAHPFGNTQFGASLKVESYDGWGGANAFQLLGMTADDPAGDYGWGPVVYSGITYAGNANPGTQFEWAIPLNITGVGAYAGVPLVGTIGSTIGVELATQAGGTDSLPSWPNYGALTYTLVPEPGTSALVGLGLLMAIGVVRSRKSR
jgi:hypothetical protein